MSIAPKVNSKKGKSGAVNEKNSLLNNSALVRYASILDKYELYDIKLTHDCTIIKAPIINLKIICDSAPNLMKNHLLTGAKLCMHSKLFLVLFPYIIVQNL